MSFASILKSRGFDTLINVDGGFKEIKDSGKFNLTDYGVQVHYFNLSNIELVL